MTRKRCIICYTTLPNDTTCKSSALKTFTGSNGSKTLNDILTIYFIAKKLLKFSDGKCMETVEELRLKDAKGGLVFCENCECIVAEALECHEKILRLNEKINELGEKLSREISEGGSKKSFLFRNGSDCDTGDLICSDSEPPEPDPKDDLVVEIGVVSVKSCARILDADDIFANDDIVIQPVSQTKLERGTSNASESNNAKAAPMTFQCPFCSTVAFSPYGFRRHLRTHRKPPSKKKVSSGTGQAPVEMTTDDEESSVGVTNESPRQDVPDAAADEEVDIGNDDDHEWCPQSSDADDEVVNLSSSPANYGEVEVEYVPSATKRRTVAANRRRTFLSGKYASIAIAMPTRGTRFACQFCPAVYRFVQSYRRHLGVHEASDCLNNEYDCKQCGHPATGTHQLQHHIAMTHRKKKKKKVSFSKKDAVKVDGIDAEMAGRRTTLSLKETLYLEDDEDISGDGEDEDEEWCPNSDDEVHVVKRSLNNSSHENSDDGDDSHFAEEIKKKRNSQADLEGEGNQEKLECKKCNTFYKSVSTFQKHIRDHKRCKFECKLCRFPCHNKGSWLKHKYKVHERVGLVCNVCSRKFKHQYNLREHLHCHKRYDQFMDSNTGRYVCPVCPDKVGRTMSGFIIHKNYAHYTDPRLGSALATPDLPTYLCSLCGMELLTKIALKRHIQRKHENTLGFPCEICGKSFTTKQHLSSHIKTHDKNRSKNFVCTLCAAQYSYQQSLNGHMAKYHPDQLTTPSTMINAKPRKPGSFKCKWCDQVFPFKYLLVNHMPIAHKDMYTFICDVCSKAYTSASSLRLHKEILHSDGSQQFACEDCGKSFVHRHYIYTHKKFCPGKRRKNSSADNEPNMDSVKLDME